MYFCNVHREDDKVTKWIRENYTLGFFGAKYELAIVASRIFNWPDTLVDFQDALEEPNLELLYSVLTNRKNEELKIWSGAYVITTHGQKMSKIDYCVNLLKEADALLPLDYITCWDYWQHLQKIDGIGSFLAAQIVADLKNTSGHVLEHAPDWKRFVASGPGSIRGLGWLNGSSVTNYDFDSLIHHYYKEIKNKIPEMCMQDFQNCLCEFDKYCRVASGTGRSKRRYAGA